jgi:hypothetical protein
MNKRERRVLSPIRFYLTFKDCISGKKETGYVLTRVEKIVSWVVSPLIYIVIFIYAMVIGVKE